MITILIPTLDGERGQDTGALALDRAGRGNIALHVQVDGDTEGFTRTVNAGLAKIPAGDVCLYNDDCVPSDGWLAALARELGGFARLNAWFVGPSGPCRTPPQSGGRPGDGRRPRPVKHLAGFCLLVKRDALDKMGGLDEDFVHYGSEVDLQWRARRKYGATSIWVPEVYVAHQLHKPHMKWWVKDQRLLEVRHGEKPEFPGNTGR
jgi:hypothetical protein